MLSDDELRYALIKLLTAQTKRDKQRRIGASNLSNPCDFCLAANLTGDMRENSMSKRPWGGRVIGTAVHKLLEDRAYEMLTVPDSRHDPEAEELQQILGTDAMPERRLSMGELSTYGEVFTTADLTLPSHRLLVDWKTDEDAKRALMQDFMASQRGEPSLYGRTHRVHKKKTISAAQWPEKMADAEYKVTGYYNQTQLYARTLNRLGTPIDSVAIGWISRDSTMWFDNPSEDRYDDPRAVHGTWVLSFAYHEAYADQVWERGVRIWDALQAGATLADFPRHERCFACSLDREAQAKAQADATVTVDIPQAA